MSKELRIGGNFGRDFQQIFVGDEPTNIFINNEGKIKSANFDSDVDGIVTIKADAKVKLQPEIEKRFHFVTGGFKTNNNSSTFYYFQFRPLGESWSNSDSSPTTINVFDAPAALWIAPAAGKITNLTVQGYTNDTGATDPFKFYIYKGSSVHDQNSTTLSLLLKTNSISTSAGLRNVRHSEDFTGSNTFSEGDTFYVMLKKDSTSGNQDLYFSMTVSGEYT